MSLLKIKRKVDKLRVWASVSKNKHVEESCEEIIKIIDEDYNDYIMKKHGGRK